MIRPLDDGEDPFQLLPRDMVCKHQGGNQGSVIHLEPGRAAGRVVPSVSAAPSRSHPNAP